MHLLDPIKYPITYNEDEKPLKAKGKEPVKLNPEDDESEGPKDDETALETQGEGETDTQDGDASETREGGCPHLTRDSRHATTTQASPSNPQSTARKSQTLCKETPQRGRTSGAPRGYKGGAEKAEERISVCGSPPPTVTLILEKQRWKGVHRKADRM